MNPYIKQEPVLLYTPTDDVIVIEDVECNHPSILRPYKCTLCDRSFTAYPHLAIHMTTHNYSKPHKCQECNDSFSIRSSLLVHMNTHVGEKPYKCERCNDSFSIRSSLIAHMRTHKRNREEVENSNNKRVKVE